jgi:two-component system chemotaxis sensor kinase CheA
LTELEEQFAEIEGGDHSSERLNAVFRAIHSIKGGAGAFGFTRLVGFAHAYETLLDKVREGSVGLSAETVALCIRAIDIAADFVAAARNGSELAADYGEAEKQRFDALCNGGADAAAGDDEPMEEFDIDFTPVRVDLDKDEPLSGEAEAAPAPASLDSFESPPLPPGTKLWEIRFRPHRELYARANDPLLLFRELATLGELTVKAILDEVPLLADFEPFGVYCNWELLLASVEADEPAIREVFEFVDGNCDLAIAKVVDAVAIPAPPHEPAASRLPDFADLMPEPPVPDESPAAPPAPAAETAASPSFAELANAVRSAAAARPAPAPTPAAAAEPVQLHPAPPHPAPAEPAAHPEGEGERRNGVQTIRVDLDKVDRVVNMVGELVITQSMLTQQMDEHLRSKYQELVRGLEVLAQTTRGLQDSVMAIRAQPVKSVFSRMPRLVRDLAQKTGKKIRLETIGENTEIDKTVIEQLSDPLTHMIRNSADHGIESPEGRLAAGKPESGTIRLSAEQAGGNILIIVEDDGAGINREKVLQVARQRGVVGADEPLSDEQIDQLIFAPGFSTADTVSDISGRGVGMDVVLSNIKKIGGSVHVRSWTGKGTRMTLRLPLTLAVLDVMLVRVAQNPYVIPLSSIVETMQCARANFERVPSGNRVLQVRGEYVQVIDLAERFELGQGLGDDNRFVVLCEAEGSVRVALVVDDIIGQQQVVIKSLEENFESIDGIAGGTILGDGNVALIVDVQGLRSAKLRRAAA